MDELHEAYDVDVAKLNRLAARSAERAEALKSENAKLRELVYDMLQDEERGHNDELTFDEHVERANELGVQL